MNQSLAGKVAIVTGASRNMGRAFAEAVAAEGASVVVHYRNSEMKAEAKTLANSIQKQGNQAMLMQADLTHVDEIEKLFDATIQRFGRLDILINTAGMVIKKPFQEITEED
jgi:NAD(P)-dependent dehydrogenase (short-subunit alcohol dehydrogenase family)